jgi:rubrerythrin
MLEVEPIKLEKVEKKFLDREILRLAIIAELDAVSLYEQLAATTENKAIREVLLDVAKEEKTHVGEFQTLLLRVDPEQVEELKNGKEEVEKELGLQRNLKSLHLSRPVISECPKHWQPTRHHVCRDSFRSSECFA